MATIGWAGNWQGILRSITAPVILFGLVFLTLFGSFMGVLYSPLEAAHKVYVILGIALLFVITLILLFVLVWYRPTHLMYSELAHLVKDGYGSKESPMPKEEMEKRAGEPP